MEDNRAIDELEKKINHLEYDEISPLKKEVNDIKINLAENNILTKQAIETSTKLSDTMSIVKDSMIELASSMKASNKASEELAENVKTLSRQFVTLDKKVDDKINEVDNKSKIDILTWIRNNWLSIVLLLGALGYAISQIVK